ncbi:ATP-binding cassette domain-containing protein [Streptococcus mitis]|uniref:ABC transporter ATP-binding protein YxdL n=1 Tax=Streptococcus mitis TaxID=28037 RepID=A0A428D7D0_STRMT|nr:ABC transporter ATP-binding protein [Streptococcus mitis]RSI87945.1 ABC transporter ATP-binding protein YxdL [Streptococcus mitis]RSI92235.1 ABC transporter ATP-binding protein YxdL [Streptococcus mitis]
MLRRFVTKKHLVLYFFSIAITWLEAIITPALVQNIVASFTNQELGLLWKVLILGILGNLILLLGLAGKRYYYARLITDFKYGIKSAIFKRFLNSYEIDEKDILSDLENDVKQLEENYIEPTVIIISSLGFTTVSILYALWTNFYLGLIFILFYSFPVLCSAIGSKRLDSLSEKRSTVNQSYLASLTNFIGGSQQIRHYQGQDYFFARYQKQLQTSLDTEINYEKQRTLNSLLINSIDAFCSVTPIVIGGFMTYYNYLDAASFVAIYLVSHNIGYQFQELAYFTNTRKANRTLLNKYQKLLDQSNFISPRSIENIFPIQLNTISLEKYGNSLLSPISMHIKQGEKIAIIGESGSGKTTLLNIIHGEETPTSGQISFAGQNLSRKEITSFSSYILQDSHYFDTLSLEDNILLGLDKNKETLNHILKKTGLEHLKNRTLRNDSLSGGEKQRLEIARALYHDSQLILADEIKTNLDLENSRKISGLLFSLPQTVIEVIHHYTEEDLKHYDQVIHLSKEK